MSFDWWTFALQTVNFVILAWLLHRFLYKPVLRIVDARQAKIDTARAGARRLQDEAQAELERTREARSRIEAERDAIIAAARAEAETQATARRDQAARDAETLQEQARKSLQAERDAAASETRRIALDLGMDVARRLLKELPTELRTEAWLDRIETYLKDLPSGELDALLGGPADPIALRVIGAIPFPDASRKQWLLRLKGALGRDLEIAFSHDPELIAGVELHFPNAILHFSWRGALNAMREKMDTDADAR